MRARSILVLTFFAIGCGSSHTGDDGAVRGLDAAPGPRDAAAPRDAVPHDAPGDDCPPIGAPRCLDETCCGDEAAAVLQPDCHYVCPSGFVVSEACEPSASCEVEGPCTVPSECVLAPNDCCGPCGTPSLDDYDAILATRRLAHRRAVCPSDDTTACSDCVTRDDPNLGATCESGRCEEFDVRQLSLSACTSDDACVLRTRECCECGGATDPGSLVAIRGDARAQYMTLVCDDLACPECAPDGPTGVEAYCAPDGHCAIRPTP